MRRALPALMVAFLFGCSSTTNSGGAEPCETGALTCACFSNGTCASGLSCVSDVCVDLDGGAGAPGTGGTGGTATGGSPGSGGAGAAPPETGGATNGGAATGGAATGGATTGGAATGGAAPGGASPGGAGGGGASACPASQEGQITCDGSLARICMGGAWQDHQSCALSCIEGVGCACDPSEPATCVDGELQSCDANGIPTSVMCEGDTPVCDATRAACVCEDDTFTCEGSASVAMCVLGVWGTVEDCLHGCSAGACVSTQTAAGVVACTDAPGGFCTGQLCTAVLGDPAECSDTANSTSLQCDGPSDCADGQICCRGNYSLCSSYCSDSCTAQGCANFAPDLEVCDPAAGPCANGLTCAPMAAWYDGTPMWGCQ